MVFVIIVRFFAEVFDGIFFVLDEFLDVVFVEVDVFGRREINKVHCDFSCGEADCFFAKVEVVTFFDNIEELGGCFFVFIQRCEICPVGVAVCDFGVVCSHGVFPSN